MPQRQWLWDFEKPLISENEAGGAVNNFLSKIDSGDKTTKTAWTSTVAALGNTDLASGIGSALYGLIGKFGQ
jgi:hypothetical protein